MGLQVLIPLAAWVAACSLTADANQSALATDPPRASAASAPSPPEEPAPGAGGPATAPEAPPLARGEKQALFSSEAQPAQLRFALTSDALILVERTADGHRVLRLDKRRPAPRVLLERAAIERFASDDEHLYYTGGEGLWKLPLNNGAPAALAPLRGEVFLDEEHVYVRDAGAVYRVPKTGGKPTRVAETRRRAGFRTAAVLGGYVYVLASGYGNMRALLPKSAWIERAPAGGGSFERLRGLYEPGPLMLRHGDSLYFSGSLARDKEQWDYQVLRLRAGAPKRLEVAADFPLAVFAVDDRYVYAATHRYEERGLFRFPLDGGAPELVLADPDGASALAVDAEHIYWEARGTLFRALK